jgi:hypothetical protein
VGRVVVGHARPARHRGAGPRDTQPHAAQLQGYGLLETGCSWPVAKRS